MDAASRTQHRLAAAIVAVVLGAAPVLAPPRAARANGAFPDSQSILTPAFRLGEITLVTNFGLVMSNDAGQTWLWSCEQAANALGYLYQYGAAPRHRLFALAGEKLIHSDDGTCGWQAAGGAMVARGVTDFFPDPLDSERVLAVAYDYGSTAFSLVASSDAGTTFDVVLYQGAAKDGMTGVEIARSDPRTTYVTTSITARNAAMLLRSNDGGASWQPNDLSVTLGPGVARIVAVDPDDAMRVLLLFTGTARQSLALTRDGGRTVTPVLSTDGFLTSYARTSQGTILIGGSDIATNPVLFASHDGGLTFGMVPNPPPHIRGLAARDGNVYAATDNFGDGYALGISTDEGMTWRPVMSYDRMTAIVGCVKASCQTLCAQEVTMGLWSENACTADPPVVSPDAGADASRDGGGAADAGSSGGGSGGGSGGYTGGPPRAGGGSCTVSPGHARDQAWWMLLGLIVSRHRQRQRQRRRGPRGAPGDLDPHADGDGHTRA